MPEATADTPVDETKSAPGVGRWHYVLLAMIIIAGAVLRFAWLDRPALWGDEAATWARTVGTFEQMLEGNRDDGFVPLHYELYWWMGQNWKLTPLLMRLAPAIAGVVMIPAIYLLARQLVSPRIGLLAALFAATSAYYLNYSRDAKMYMQTWSMITLHVAFLLWWLRGGGGVAWWAWVASGVAAVGLHSTAWLVVPVGALMLLTSGRPHWRWLLYPVGIAVMGIGPYIYYTQYNTWAERSGGLVPTVQQEDTGRPTPNWFHSGINWIEHHNRGKSGAMLLRDSLTSYLFGYSRAEEADGVRIPPWVLDAAWGTLAGCIIVLAAGAVCWPRRRRLAVAESSRPWQRLLWLGFWVVMPTYGLFYCRSMSRSVSPVDWLMDLGRQFSWHLLWMAIAAGAVALLAVRKRYVHWIAAILLGLALVVTVACAVRSGSAQWYMAMMEYAGRPWLMGGIIALAAAVSWASVGATNKQRLKRFASAAGVAIFIFIACVACHLAWEHLRANSREWKSIWMPRYLGIIAPAVLIVMAIAISRLPGRVIPAIVASAFVAINLAQYTARLALDPEPRVDLMAYDMALADRDPTVAVFIRDRGTMPSQGGAGVNDTATRYYLYQHIDGEYSPNRMYNGPTDVMLKKPFSRYHNVGRTSRELKRRPETTRLIIWQRRSLAPETPEQIEKGLDGEWTLVSEWSQRVWRHWNWQEMDGLRRLEFSRVMPASAPAQ